MFGDLGLFLVAFVIAARRSGSTVVIGTKLSAFLVNGVAVSLATSTTACESLCERRRISSSNEGEAAHTHRKTLGFIHSQLGQDLSVQLNTGLQLHELATRLEAGSEPG